MLPTINKDTVLCMSLSGRPGNTGTRFHNYLYRELGLNFLYKAFTTKDLPGAHHGHPRAGHPRLRRVDALQGSLHSLPGQAYRLRCGDPVGEHHRQR